jgi:DNA-binding PadR family transcriptional regulator
VTRDANQGTRLEVFSGKEADLNRVLLRTFEMKSPLIAYDAWHLIRAVKSFKRVDSKTAYRRMAALEQEGLIAEKGARLGKRGGEKTLYKLTLRGKAALKLDKKSINNFLRTATDEQLAKFLDLFP